MRARHLPQIQRLHSVILIHLLHLSHRQTPPPLPSIFNQQHWLKHWAWTLSPGSTENSSPMGQTITAFLETGSWNLAKVVFQTIPVSCQQQFIGSRHEQTEPSIDLPCSAELRPRSSTLLLPETEPRWAIYTLRRVRAAQNLGSIGSFAGLLETGNSSSIGERKMFCLRIVS